MNLNLQQSPRVTQKLNLAPQLLQWLQLLQSPTIQLSQLVKQELETNPALETDNDDIDNIDSQTEDDLTDDYAESSLESELNEDNIDEKYDFLAENGFNESEDYMQDFNETKHTSTEAAQEKYEYRYNSISPKETLQEHLRKQIPFAELDEQDSRVVEFIVGSIDERGYLDISIEELAGIVNMSLDKIEHLLSIVQNMHPAGVGARNLRECLLLQTEKYDDESVVRKIIINYLHAVARKQYQGIADLLNVSRQEVLDAVKIINSLTPKPGDKFIDTETRYVNPDILIVEQNGDYTIELKNDYIPPLHISASCKQLLSKKHLSSQETSYLKKKIRAANFIIQGIQQRHETIHKVTKQIINIQKEFISSEDGKLKSLTMADVANRIGVHETTVSRAIANKYISTPRGVFPLKHFFSSGYHCADGSSVTPEAVKEIISDYVDDERAESPFTDIQISKKLDQKGFHIARRTIAKYREELGIPSSKQRKKMYRSSDDVEYDHSMANLTEAAVV
jgi:RNA polymerase sigma-54 factor